MSTTVTPSIGHAPVFTQRGVGASPGYDAIDARRSWSPVFQEGVIEATAYMVVQRALGTNMSVDIGTANDGSAYVQGDSVTLQSLYFVAPHNTVINEAITPAHATLPRVDAVILEIQDDVHDGSGNNQARVRVVAGTPTAGATLNNARDGSHGGAVIPPNALHLADVFVGAAVSSITNANIRDRRKWARGAKCRIVRNINEIGTNDYYLSNTTLALLDPANLAPRIECSGVPVRVRLIGNFSGTGSSLPALIFFSPQVDGAGVNGMASVGGSPNTASLCHSGDTGTIVYPLFFEWEFTPSVGSHVIAPAMAFTNAGGQTGAQIKARAGWPLIWTVDEIVRQDTRNNSVTTG